MSDIQEYFEIGKTKASSIMKAAKKISTSRYLPSKAKRDVVLEINQLSFKEEVKKLEMLEV